PSWEVMRQQFPVLAGTVELGVPGGRNPHGLHPAFRMSAAELDNRTNNIGHIRPLMPKDRLGVQLDDVHAGVKNVEPESEGGPLLLAGETVQVLNHEVAALGHLALANRFKEVAEGSLVRTVLAAKGRNSQVPERQRRIKWDAALPAPSLRVGG